MPICTLRTNNRLELQSCKLKLFDGTLRSVASSFFLFGWTLPYLRMAVLFGLKRALPSSPMTVMGCSTCMSRSSEAAGMRARVSSLFAHCARQSSPLPVLSLLRVLHLTPAFTRSLALGSHLTFILHHSS